LNSGSSVPSVPRLVVLARSQTSIGERERASIGGAPESRPSGPGSKHRLGSSSAPDLDCGFCVPEHSASTFSIHIHINVHTQDPYPHPRCPSPKSHSRQPGSAPSTRFDTSSRPGAGVWPFPDSRLQSRSIGRLSVSQNSKSWSAFCNLFITSSTHFLPHLRDLAALQLQLVCDFSSPGKLRTATSSTWFSQHHPAHCTSVRHSHAW
jgi:hypothetical protein